MKSINQDFCLKLNNEVPAVMTPWRFFDRTNHYEPFVFLLGVLIVKFFWRFDIEFKTIHSSNGNYEVLRTYVNFIFVSENDSKFFCKTDNTSELCDLHTPIPGHGKLAPETTANSDSTHIENKNNKNKSHSLQFSMTSH